MDWEKSTLSPLERSNKHKNMKKETERERLRTKNLDRNTKNEQHQCDVKAHYENLEFRSQNLCSVAFRVDCIARDSQRARTHTHIHTECIKQQWNDSLTKIPSTAID